MHMTLDKENLDNILDQYGEEDPVADKDTNDSPLNLEQKDEKFFTSRAEEYRFLFWGQDNDPGEIRWVLLPKDIIN